MSNRGHDPLRGFWTLCAWLFVLDALVLGNPAILALALLCWWLR